MALTYSPWYDFLQSPLSVGQNRSPSGFFSGSTGGNDYVTQRTNTPSLNRLIQDLNKVTSSVSGEQPAPVAKPKVMPKKSTKKSSSGGSSSGASVKDKYTPSPFDKELESYRELALKEADNKEREAIALREQQKILLENSYAAPDLSPAMAFFDSRVGGNTLRGYKNPSNIDQNLSAALKLQQMADKSKADAGEIRTNSRKVAAGLMLEDQKNKLQARLEQLALQMKNNQFNQNEYNDLLAKMLDYKSTQDKIKADANKQAKGKELVNIAKNKPYFEAMQGFRDIFSSMRKITGLIRKQPELVSGGGISQKLSDEIRIRTGRGDETKLKLAQDRYQLGAEFAAISRALLKAQESGRVSNEDAKAFKDQVVDVYSSNPELAITNYSALGRKFGEKYNIWLDDLAPAWDVSQFKKINLDTLNYEDSGAQTTPSKDVKSMTDEEIEAEIARLKAGK